MIADIILKKNLLNLKKKIKFPNDLHKPSIDKNDLIFLKQTIQKSEVSTYGRYSRQFEIKIGNYLNTKNIISTVNGTSALEAILSYLNINYDHEILVQSFTFVATVNPIIHLGASPHFIDISRETLGTDPEKLDKYLSSDKFKKKNGKLINKITNKTVKALIITHSYGYPVNIEKIVKIAKKFKLVLIEDAAETLGTKYKNKKLGTYGDFSILSFNGNKTITTGGGGIIISKKKKDILKIKHLITTSKKIIGNNTYYDSPGYNLRMPSLNAALGLSQLQKLKNILSLKKKLFLFYKNFFQNIPFVKIFNGFDNECYNNFWIMLIIFNPNKINKNKFLKISKSTNLRLSQVWRPLHTMSYLKNYQKMNLDNSNFVFKSTLCLPSSPDNL